MVNYSVTTYTTLGTFETVTAALETKIETVDNAKTIRHWQIEPVGHEWHGYLVYDT